MIRLFIAMLLLPLAPLSAQAKVIEFSYLDFFEVTSTDDVTSARGFLCGGLCDELFSLTFASSGSVSSNLDRLGVGQSTNKLSFRIGGPGEFIYSGDFAIPFLGTNFSTEGAARFALIEFGLASDYTLTSPIDSQELLLSFSGGDEFFSPDGTFGLIGIEAEPLMYKVQVVPIPAAAILLNSSIFLLGMLKPVRARKNAMTSI